MAIKTISSTISTRFSNNICPSLILHTFLSFVLLAPSHVYATLIYTTADFGNTLATMDTTTGATNVVGSFGSSRTYGNAFDLDGTLFATTGSNSLSTVNMSTGLATNIGFLSESMYAIEIDSFGNLFGLAWSGNLYNINKSSGAGTLIGNTGIGNAMDLAFDSNDNLFATVSGILYEIDELTASILDTTSISLGGANMGIMFDKDDTLWATVYQSNSGLYTLDVTTGAASLAYATTLDGPHGGDIYVARSVPEPSILMLVGLGLSGVLFARRKKA